MQHQRQADGSLTQLSGVSVDTGMGLERVCAVLQGVPTNFDSDVFQPMIDHAFDVLQLPSTVATRGVGISLQQKLTTAQQSATKVIVDHVRASVALVADGVVPANMGRGYVLRRIIRRAVRYATLLGATRPVLCKLVPVAVRLQSPWHPEIVSRAPIVEVLFFFIFYSTQRGCCMI